MDENVGEAKRAAVFGMNSEDVSRRSLSQEFLQIKDCALGKGLFTTKRVGKDEVVFTLSGDIFDKPTRETIYIGGNKHIYDNYGMFINHSFAPTVRIEGVNVVAIRDIDADEELVFNYNDNEINMAAPFVVGGVLVCGSDSRKN